MRPAPNDSLPGGVIQPHQGWQADKDHDVPPSDVEKQYVAWSSLRSEYVKTASPDPAFEKAKELTVLKRQASFDAVGAGSAT